MPDADEKEPPLSEKLEPNPLWGGSERRARSRTPPPISVVRVEDRSDTTAAAVSPPAAPPSAQSDSRAAEERPSGEGELQSAEWSEQEEFLLALWSDRALCYKLLSDRACRKFHRQHLWFSIPVIVLSTFCGSANLAVKSYVPDSGQAAAGAVIGVISLGAGVLTTLMNFFSAAQKSESHRNAATSWGKLHRTIYTELSLERTKRKPVRDFLRLSKNEYDRILDQSPAVPSDVLRRFAEDIKRHPALALPEECGNLLHTSSWERVRQRRGSFLEDRFGDAQPPPESMVDTP